MTDLLARIHSNDVLAQFDGFLSQFLNLETAEDEAVVFALLSELVKRVEAVSIPLRDRIKARFEESKVTGKQYYSTPDGAHTVCLTMTPKVSVTFDHAKLRELLTSRNIPLKKAGKVTLQIDQARLEAVLKEAGLKMEQVCTETFTPEYAKIEKLAAANILTVDELADVCKTQTTYALGKEFVAANRVVDIGMEQVTDADD